MIGMRSTLTMLLGSLAIIGCISVTPSGSRSEIGPGMNAKGEVIDPRNIEPGHGQQVKGIGDWQGEIVGKPAPDSAFTKLKIGMSIGEAKAIAGQPTEQGAYKTGKAWIPYYFGKDRYRYVLVFKGQGRLIFASNSDKEFYTGDFYGGHLIWIIHSIYEDGNR